MATDVASAIMHHLGPITPLLDESLALAIRSAEKRCVGVDHNRFGFLRAAAVRVDMRMNLEARTLPDGWTLAGDPSKMGQLLIRKPGAMTLRFLRANPLQPGLVPHAGPGVTRRRTWVQPSIVANPADSTPSVEVNLLLLWAYEDASSREDGFSLLAAHPLSPGRFGARVPCDLVAPIPRGGTVFEDLAAFGHDEDEDLFEVDIAEESVQ